MSKTVAIKEHDRLFDVYDADGVEIKPGDTVWNVKTADKYKVSTFTDSDKSVNVVNGKGGGLTLPPSRLTHRAPVLAADGKPLREGEMVYKVGGDGTAYVFDGMSDNVDRLAMLHHDGKPYIGTGLRVDHLTHERPNSWERLEHDAEKSACNYFGVNGYCGDCPHRITECSDDLKKDLVRRARKLAERGE